MNVWNSTQLYALSEVWRILVEKCGASSDYSDFLGFINNWPECREYRFMGNFGMGGKIWYNPVSDQPVYVNFYPEDATKDRTEAQAAANEKLKELGPVVIKYLEETPDGKHLNNVG